LNEARNDVDTDITLDSLVPPTYQGRALQWSGERGAGRVPELGETVCWDEGPLRIVVGYFQGHGFLGVKLRFYTGEMVCLFGAEIDVMRTSPDKVVNFVIEAGA
jgi:hypothetical protein